MGRASGGSNTPHWIRNNIFDFLRAMSVKIAVENGKICNKTTCITLQSIGASSSIKRQHGNLKISRQLDSVQTGVANQWKTKSL